MNQNNQEKPNGKVKLLTPHKEIFMDTDISVLINMEIVTNPNNKINPTVKS